MPSKMKATVPVDRYQPRSAVNKKEREEIEESPGIVRSSAAENSIERLHDPIPFGIPSHRSDLIDTRIRLDIVLWPSSPLCLVCGPRFRHGGNKPELAGDFLFFVGEIFISPSDTAANDGDGGATSRDQK